MSAEESTFATNRDNLRDNLRENGRRQERRTAARTRGTPGATAEEINLQRLQTTTMMRTMMTTRMNGEIWFHSGLTCGGGGNGDDGAWL